MGIERRRNIYRIGIDGGGARIRFEVLENGKEIGHGGAFALKQHAPHVIRQRGGKFHF